MFLIPMCGLSSRFFKAGYDKPKYMLDLNGETVFSWSVKSFERYFLTDKFVFIYRDIYGTKSFLEQEIKKLGIRDFAFICLDHETEGQAETVYLGLEQIVEDDALYIFNIDSKIVDFRQPEWVKDCDAYLEVFQGEGDHWSFALPDTDGRTVLKTTEKERISDLCSDGLYYFKSKSLFIDLFQEVKEKGEKTKSEYYIAPLYNYLIQQGKKVYYDLIDKNNILFCGTPDEYLALLSFKQPEKVNHGSSTTQKVRVKKIVIDLDNTISMTKNRDYANAEPIMEVVEKIREYKQMGFDIVIYSSRNMKTYQGNIGKITANTLPIIIDWLKRHNIPFDEIYIGKPWCGEDGFYVDDRAIRPSEITQLSYEEIQKITSEGQGETQ